VNANYIKPISVTVTWMNCNYKFYNGIVIYPCLENSDE